MGDVIRLIEVGDAPTLAAVTAANRAFLAPWEPVRGEAFFTEEGQRSSIVAALAEHEAGRAAPFVILDSGEIVGRIVLNTIVRGPFRSASLGYWVAESRNGRGIATAAVRAVARVAFRELGLHRIQADTLIHNVASQRVLLRSGFTHIGTAPSYLCIASRWQDFHLFQLLDEAGDASC